MIFVRPCDLHGVASFFQRSYGATVLVRSFGSLVCFEAFNVLTLQTFNSPPEQVAEQVPTGHTLLPFLYTTIHDFARLIRVQTLFACDGNLSPGLDDLVKEFLCLVAGHDSRALVVQQCGRRTLKYTNRGRVG